GGGRGLEPSGCGGGRPLAGYGGEPGGRLPGDRVQEDARVPGDPRRLAGASGRAPGEGVQGARLNHAVSHTSSRKVVRRPDSSALQQLSQVRSPNPWRISGACHRTCLLVTTP